MAALIKAGADPVPPLHRAVEDYSMRKAAVLIDAGADVNARREDGWTPLHIATRKDSPELVEWLLGAGADTNVTADVQDPKRGSGETPLQVAAQFTERSEAQPVVA